MLIATSFPGSPLLLRKETLVAACHVAPKIWELFQMCFKGGVAVYALSSAFVPRRKTTIKRYTEGVLCTTHGIRHERQKVVV